MARSSIISTTLDLTDDNGSSLWSFVKGEQLEFPAKLNFLTHISPGYIFEAVVVEALNVSGDMAVPETVKPGGVQTVINVRAPRYVGIWTTVGVYNTDEVVFYGGFYYRLINGTNLTDIVPPDTSPLWELHEPNTIYLQFPSTLASTWAVQPTVSAPVRGFFELRVTEPSSLAFPRTFKPMRGLVEILFSPTDLVS